MTQDPFSNETGHMSLRGGGSQNRSRNDAQSVRFGCAVNGSVKPFVNLGASSVKFTNGVMFAAI